MATNHLTSGQQTTTNTANPNQAEGANVHQLAPSHDPSRPSSAGSFFDPVQPGSITTYTPAYRLGYGATIFILVNRMIGTGIFNTPSIAMRATQSQGVTLVFWAVGGIAAMAAALLYVEFGLNTPRYKIKEEEEGVPRSGGELNYLRYTFRKPEFLTTCVFGIPFIIFGNVAANSIAFAQYVFKATGTLQADLPNGSVRGVAIALATFACTVHAFSRRGGIWLSNLLACIKIGILLLIFSLGMSALAGHFHIATYGSANLSPHTSFSHHSGQSSDYARAFLAILFAYDGWNQANYVLAEIDDPRKTFKRSVPVAVFLVWSLYMMVNIAYMVVVSPDDQIDATKNTAEVFFENTIGQLSSNKAVPRIIVNTFMAISSFGNVVTMTFTAARVKQEIAKEAILPFRNFFAKGRDMSLPRLLKKMRGNPAVADHLEETPVGALVLQWCFSVLLILVTYPMSSNDAYALLINIYSSIFAAFFPAVIGMCMLFLRLRRKEHWNDKSDTWRLVSYSCAVIVIIAGVFPLAGEWWKGTATISGLAWFIPPTVSWATLVLGVLYWIVFVTVIPNMGSHKGKRLLVEREPITSEGDGYPVQDMEVVHADWVFKNRRTPTMEMYSGDEATNYD